MNRKITILLSLFIVFHFIAVLLYPNPSSVLYRYLEPIVGAYGNQFGFNTTWQFFSPDPGSLRYIKYNVIIESDDKIDIHKYTFPPQMDPSLLKSNQARLFYYTVRMITHQPNIENFLIPYLCRKHPEATSIALKPIDKKIPTMEKARYQQADSFSDLHQNVYIPEQEFGCQREDSK
ncbi:MAG: hypothetical protein KDD58_06535 [Bdellovibrionales bacterium]|nr:hypothetical protein [Bdellovibrionales bacterium]